MNEMNIPSELNELSNEVGEFICYWGFKRIHGRIWTHIYLSNEPLDAGQLMKRLKVSKALISLSLSDLLDYDVVRESGKSARGTLVYAANPDVISVILNVLRRRERKMLAQAETSHRLLTGLTDACLEQACIHNGRLDAIGHMIQQAQSTLSGLLELASIDHSVWSKFKSDES